MEAETLAALEGSIAKWRAIADGTGEDDGPRNCPLCKAFNKPGMGCAGCPVRDETGESHCSSTPYEQWETAMERDGRDPEVPYVADTEELKALATEELQFLESLRPASDVLPSAGGKNAEVEG